MSDLKDRHCAPCHGGMAPHSAAKAQVLMRELAPEWHLAPDAQSIRREFKFKDFYRTMSFVNALAHIANIEDHHPDLEVGYNYCRILFTTHAIGGLSDNDFICAAKIERIEQAVPPTANHR